MKSARPAIWPDDSAHCAPLASAAARFAGLTSCTITAKPLFTRCPMMGIPMRPAPIRPTICCAMLQLLVVYPLDPIILSALLRQHVHQRGLARLDAFDRARE